jgi:hypothetical protein
VAGKQRVQVASPLLPPLETTLPCDYSGRTSADRTVGRSMRHENATLETPMTKVCATFFATAVLLLAAPSFVSADDKEEGFVSLFNGNDLTGWKVGDADQSQIKVENGEIVVGGPRAHIFTDENFKNFHFKAEVKTTPGSNSGIYFHSKYQDKGFPDNGHESQVNVSHGDPVKTGSIYNVVKLFETPAKDNEWWTQEIIVKGQNVVVKINGKVVLDYTEPPGVIRGRRVSEGCFALQAHDPKSTTYYRNIRVKRLPDETK